MRTHGRAFLSRSYHLGTFLETYSFFIPSFPILCAERDWLCLPSLSGRFVTKFSGSEPVIESSKFPQSVVHLGAILVAVTLSRCYRPTVKPCDRQRRTPKTVNRMQPLNSTGALGKQFSVLTHLSVTKNGLVSSSRNGTTTYETQSTSNFVATCASSLFCVCVCQQNLWSPIIAQNHRAYQSRYWVKSNVPLNFLHRTLA